MAFDEDDLARISADLDHALDGLLDARFAICPCPREWCPPSGALRAEVLADPEMRRGRTRADAIFRDLREHVSEQLRDDVWDLDAAVRDIVHRAAEVGWLAGAGTFTRRKPVEAVNASWD